MTAVSSGAVACVGNTGACPAASCPSVRDGSTGLAAFGSTVITISSRHAGTSSHASRAIAAIGSCGVPSKTSSAFASLSFS